MGLKGLSKLPHPSGSVQSMFSRGFRPKRVLNPAVKIKKNYAPPPEKFLSIPLLSTFVPLSISLIYSTAVTSVVYKIKDKERNQIQVGYCSNF